MKLLRTSHAMSLSSPLYIVRWKITLINHAMYSSLHSWNKLTSYLTPFGNTFRTRHHVEHLLAYYVLKVCPMVLIVRQELLKISSFDTLSSPDKKKSDESHSCCHWLHKALVWNTCSSYEIRTKFWCNTLVWNSPVNSPHKGQWRGALMLFLIWAWINGWLNDREADDLRRHCVHYDIIVMNIAVIVWDSGVGIFSKQNIKDFIDLISVDNGCHD